MTNLRRLISLTERVSAAPSLFTPGGIRGLDGSYVDTSVRGGGVPDIASANEGNTANWLLNNPPSANWVTSITAFPPWIAGQAQQIGNLLVMFLDDAVDSGLIEGFDFDIDYNTDVKVVWGGSELGWVYRFWSNDPIRPEVTMGYVEVVDAWMPFSSDPFTDPAGNTISIGNTFSRWFDDNIISNAALNQFRGLVLNAMGGSLHYIPGLGFVPLLPLDVEFMSSLANQNFLPDWLRHSFQDLPDGYQWRWGLVTDGWWSQEVAGFEIFIQDADGNKIGPSLTLNPYTHRFDIPGGSTIGFTDFNPWGSVIPDWVSVPVADSMMLGDGLFFSDNFGVPEAIRNIDVIDTLDEATRRQRIINQLIRRMWGLAL